MNTLNNQMFELTVRLSQKDTHYSDNLIAGSKLLELSGDAVTGLSATLDGDEGLLSSWSEVNFLKKIQPGDFLNVKAILTKKTRLKREVEITITRFISSISNNTSSVENIDPELVFNAKGTIVIPYLSARNNGGLK